jgi:hypothetical protein
VEIVPEHWGLDRLMSDGAWWSASGRVASSCTRELAARARRESGPLVDNAFASKRSVHDVHERDVLPGEAVGKE